MKSMGELLRQALPEFNIAGTWSSLVRPYDPVTGWQMVYPNIDTWDDNTIAVMHLQDFVTVKGGHCLELGAIEHHFKECPERVLVVNWTMDLEKNYNGPLNLAYFPWHSYQLLANLKETRSEWEPLLDTSRTVNWQCLNGLARPHRRLVVEFLQNHYSRGILSFGTKVPLPNWDYSSYKGCENETNWMRLIPVAYSQCAANIVTETFYYTPGIITEKTIMAFLALQVPVVIGHRGIVEQIERLGFDMFSDVVDTSYDNLPNDVRLEQALKRNQHILTGDYDYKSLQDRLQANREYALNVWPELLVEQFNNSVRDTLQNLRQSS